MAELDRVDTTLRIDRGSDSPLLLYAFDEDGLLVSLAAFSRVRVAIAEKAGDTPLLLRDSDDANCSITTVDGNSVVRMDSPTSDELEGLPAGRYVLQAFFYIQASLTWIGSTVASVRVAEPIGGPP